MVTHSVENGPSEDYLFMNNSADSAPISIIMQSVNVDYQYSPQLHRVGKETNNSVEMLPKRSSPNPEVDHLKPSVNEFSSPIYQNSPAISCTDLDDIPV